MSSAASVPEAVAPPPGHPRFPLVDSVRALGALAIVLLHTASLSAATAWYAPVMAHLDIGVAMFFVLSGFLLYRPFVAARILGAPRSRTAEYARRRFLRIAPAFWLALTVLAIFPGIHGVFTENWWVYYGLLQNYPIYTFTADCAAETLKCGIDPAWSLGVEVGFYVTLPLVALGVAWLVRHSRRARWTSVEGVALALISVASIPLVSGLGGTWGQWAFFSPLGHGFWFALGMGIAVVSVRVQQTGTHPAFLLWAIRRPLVPWALAACLYAVACLWVYPGELGPDAEYRYLLFGLISVLVLLPAVFGDASQGLPGRVLGSPKLAWLGLVSYGIFLWHWPVVYALVEAGVTGWWPPVAFPLLTTLTILITLGCATVSYYLVERPLMRLKNSRSPRTLGAARLRA